MHADPDFRPPPLSPLNEMIAAQYPPLSESRDCYLRSPAGTRCGECAGCKRYLADHMPVPVPQPGPLLPRNERIRVDVHPRDLETIATVARQSVRTFAQHTLHALEPRFDHAMVEVVAQVARGEATSPEDLYTDHDFGSPTFGQLKMALQSQYYLAFTTITCLLTATALMREAGPHG